MPEFLYIGQNTAGTTSAMRNKYLSGLLTGWNCSVIDTNEIFLKQNSLFKSLAFRYQRGPAIKAINQYILSKLEKRKYGLIWIDKGVFLREDTVRTLRAATTNLVHFTPDMAFISNPSDLFNVGIGYYDFLITTKSQETEFYRRYIPESKLILTTQGFDRHVHRPSHLFEEKRGVIMIGLYEPDRGWAVRSLLENGIDVRVAGVGWESFAKKYSRNLKFTYLGRGLFGGEYGRAISSALFGLGMLSKRFPERHTTRTFEIPACGTALVTEYNAEIAGFFKDDEVIYFNDYSDMAKRILWMQQHLSELQALTQRGFEKVMKGGFDYESILKALLTQILTPR